MNRYDGETIIPELDNARLDSQLGRVWMLMLDGRWRTLQEIARRTRDPEGSIGARLRDFRKPRFGEHEIRRRRRGEPRRGLHEYQLVPNLPEPQQAALFGYMDGSDP